MSTYQTLLELIEGLRIIDTHEHLPAEADRPQDSDVLSEWLIHYFSCDLVSAGLTPQALEVVRDPSGDLLNRWKLAEPYWNAARSTGYGRALDLSAKGLYGIDGVSRKTIGQLNEAFLAARQQGNHYKYVLKDKSRISVSILSTEQIPCDRKFFLVSLVVNEVIQPAHRMDLVRMGQRYRLSVHSLDDWKELIELWLDDALAKGIVALKCPLAYYRTLHFAKTTTAQAEKEFNLLFAEQHSPENRQAIKMPKALEDHLMHHLLKLADQRGLVMQVHTGIQEGHGNVITDSNPTLMTNLFLEYENVKFDLFHMSYPYMLELSNLAKNFRNVFIDMCWGHIVSPTAARRSLAEWLDAVPANKISAFGGDYCFVDAVYGHQLLARQNVAASLAQKVADGSFDLDRAKEIARWVFVDNPTKLYGLEKRPAKQSTPRRKAAKQRKKK